MADTQYTAMNITNNLYKYIKHQFRRANNGEAIFDNRIQDKVKIIA